jgi:hypothetical protein
MLLFNCTLSRMVTFPAAKSHTACAALPLQNGPPRMQRLDEPQINSQPAGSPYVTFLESPSSHDFQRGEVTAHPVVHARPTQHQSCFNLSAAYPVVGNPACRVA